jgi:Leucine-rich repeat (LRR) protein
MTKILVFFVAVVLIAGGVALYMQARDEEMEKAPPIVGTDTTTTTPANAPKGETENKDSIVPGGLMVDLSGRGLKKAPEEIFDRTDIQELNLSNNLIEGSLQAEVRNLQNLKVLNLSNNQFSGVPAEIGQLKNLEVLNLSNNLITGLPYELGNLGKLKTLNLKGNAYSKSDLEIIKQGLPDSVVIEVD